MDKWVQVVTNPLGLVAFALFIVFSALAKSRAHKERAVFLVLAALTLVTTVGVAAWLALQPAPARPTSSTSAPTPASSSTVYQSTKGDNSPAISNVGGSVTIENKGSTSK